MSVDWEELNAKLPYQKNEEEKAQRSELWTSIDVNGNGYLSLAEVSRGIRDVINMDELFDATPAINRSFFYCKGISGAGHHGPDYLERSEFRVFLQTLRLFFEFFHAFEMVDAENDRRISREEFTAPEVRETIEKWIGGVEDIEAEFDSIDVNGGGQILFSEFVDWALSKDLDIEGDIDEAEADE
ncbi:flagellar calcium-binding protein TB-44A [Eurytemora carolleeae]|uniref:flagellar calcium-binding protein TB-44A n=1 Tax=Eurytemora carolleeae TaxID=1294199 RepID=UPI000C7909A7|nr:flagellar calcium-binding protein TB-44A [Eurytemora carolleeae]|eukprot:XP_023336637.1 flagellar calcium-binding protein TB-44A-like [Eurytemora affinis]